MAASMFRGHGKLLQKICTKCRGSLETKRHVSTSYIVLLPEMPPDTEETNPIMRYKDFPEFSNITAENVVRGGAKRALEFETEFDKHLLQLEDKSYSKSFDTIFRRIEELQVPLNYAWRTGKLLAYVSNEDYEYAYKRIDRQTQGALHERFSSEILLNSLKELNVNRDKLTEEQRRILDSYLFELGVTGLLMTQKKRRDYYEILRKINKNMSDYGRRVETCRNLFEHPLDDFRTVEPLPKTLLCLMAADPMDYEKGPWKVKLYNPIYNDFMAHCPDRTTRWNVWWAKVNVSSHAHGAQFLNNNETIQDIRARRNVIADIFGFKHYAEMQQQRRMAGGVDSVVELLETVKTAAFPKAEKELADLNEYAKSQMIFKGDLKDWDLAYYKTQKGQDLIGMNADALREYFPVPVVFKGLFDLCFKLFGVKFQENKKLDVWHEDVMVYDILDQDGSYISTIYIDPFIRPGKRIGIWMEMGASKSDITGTKPFSYMGLNIVPVPNSSGTAYMTFQDIQELFEMMGHGLQQLLTTVGWTEITGQLNIEWDSMYAVSKVMTKWLTRPEVLMSISCDPSTGKPMTEELANKLIQGEGQLDALKMCKELHMSAFDIECHVLSWKTFWYDIFEKTHRNYVPMALDGDDFSPNSFSISFAGHLGAAYYSLVWSEMLAADLFAAFQEAGFNNEKELAVVGKRFRDTYLSLGGSVSASEVFRQFRGREPSVQPMLEQYK